MVYRDNGAIGAILDEYEKSVKELLDILSSISQEELETIVDLETKDEDCRSIQTILSHVIGAGYNYIIVMRKHLGEELAYRNKEKLETIEAYRKELNLMFNYGEQLFVDYPNLKMDHFDNENKIKVKWNNTYDLEQLFEHTIVHILTHRRQIQRFLLKLRI